MALPVNSPPVETPYRPKEIRYSRNFYSRSCFANALAKDPVFNAALEYADLLNLFLSAAHTFCGQTKAHPTIVLKGSMELRGCGVEVGSSSSRPEKVEELNAELGAATQQGVRVRLLGAGLQDAGARRQS